MGVSLELALSWVRVRFKDPMLEREFIHSKYRKLVFRLRMVAMSMFLIGLMELPSSALESMNLQVILFTVSSVVSLSMTSLTFLEKFKQNPVFIRVASSLFWISTSITLMGIRLKYCGALVDWYLLSLIPTILLAVKVPVLDGLAVSLLIMSIFIGYIEMTLEPATTSDFIVGLLLTAMMALFGANYIEVKVRRAFLSFRQCDHHIRHVVHRTASADRLLHNIFPQQIAEQLKTGAKALEINKAVKSGSIIFICMKSLGFDPLQGDDSGNVVDGDFLCSAALHLAHNTLVQLNTEFARIEKMCEVFEVEKIKTIGNVFMAGCGFPKQREDHPILVANFCLALIELATSRCMDIQIGFHVGPLVAGVLACNVSYDVWGDTVNTSSRMCTHGASCRVHVSEAVKDALGATEFLFQDRGFIDVKGKGPMRTFFLLGKKEGLRGKPQRSLHLDRTPSELECKSEQPVSTPTRARLGHTASSLRAFSQKLFSEAEDLGLDSDLIPGGIVSSPFKGQLKQAQSYFTTEMQSESDVERRSRLMSLVSLAASSARGSLSTGYTAANATPNFANEQPTFLAAEVSSCEAYPRHDVAKRCSWTEEVPPTVKKGSSPLVDFVGKHRTHQRRHAVLRLADLTFQRFQEDYVFSPRSLPPQADNMDCEGSLSSVSGLWTQLKLLLFNAYEGVAFGGSHALDETERKHYQRVQSAMSCKTFRFLDPSLEAAFWNDRWHASKSHFRWFVALMTVAAVIVEGLDWRKMHEDLVPKFRRIGLILLATVLVILASFSPYWSRHPRLCVMAFVTNTCMYFNALLIEDFLLHPDHLASAAHLFTIYFITFSMFMGLCPTNSFVVVIPVSAASTLVVFWVNCFNAAVFICFIIAALASMHLERAARFAFLSRTFEQTEAMKLVELRNRTEDILFSILPVRIVNFLQDVPRGSSDFYVMETFCNVSVVAMDIVKFTVLSTNLTATTLVTMLDDIFSTFDELATQFQVCRVKTLGDCYVAFTSGPDDGEEKEVTHTYHIACFASACLRFLQSYRNSAVDSELGYAYRLNMRAGVGTGSAIAGVIGTKSLRYDIWGPAVDRAFHEEETSVAGHIKVCVQSLRHLNEYVASTGLTTAPYTTLPCMSGTLLKPNDGVELAT